MKKTLQVGGLYYTSLQYREALQKNVHRVQRKVQMNNQSQASSQTSSGTVFIVQCIFLLSHCAHEIRVHNNGSNPSKCILCVQNIKLKLKVFHFNFLLWCHVQGCLQNFFIEVAIWGPLKILGWHPNNRMSRFIVLLSNIGHSKIMIKKREKVKNYMPN